MLKLTLKITICILPLLSSMKPTAVMLDKVRLAIGKVNISIRMLGKLFYTDVIEVKSLMLKTHIFAFAQLSCYMTFKNFMALSKLK